MVSSGISRLVSTFNLPLLPLPLPPPPPPPPLPDGSSSSEYKNEYNSEPGFFPS